MSECVSGCAKSECVCVCVSERKEDRLQCQLVACQCLREVPRLFFLVGLREKRAERANAAEACEGDGEDRGEEACSKEE